MIGAGGVPIARLFGIEIRRKPEKVAAVDADPKLRDNVKTSP